MTLLINALFFFYFCTADLCLQFASKKYGTVFIDGSKSLYERLKSINPKKTLGTVLVLCGWKLYFSMYHPMHSSPSKKNFLGFDDDGENASSDDSDMDRASREEVRFLK